MIRVPERHLRSAAIGRRWYLSSIDIGNAAYCLIDIPYYLLCRAVDLSCLRVSMNMRSSLVRPLTGTRITEVLKPCTLSRYSDCNWAQTRDNFSNVSTQIHFWLHLHVIWGSCLDKEIECLFVLAPNLQFGIPKSLNSTLFMSPDSFYVSPYYLISRYCSYKPTSSRFLNRSGPLSTPSGRIRDRDKR